MCWGKEHLPPGVRSLVGLLLMVGGVFGFLPVLGFWMFPLGIAFIALDIPFTAHRIDDWMVTLKEQAQATPSDRRSKTDSDDPPDNQAP